MGFKLTREYHIDCGLLLKHLEGLKQSCVSGAKLVAGKTYVLKDEESKQDYFSSNSVNLWCMENYYQDGFKLEVVDVFGNGVVSEYIVMLADEIKYFKLKEENVMPIKPEDEVTITTTYRELAMVYAILGKTAPAGRSSIFNQVSNLLDPTCAKYSEVIYPITNPQGILNYYKYQAKWEGVLFGAQETQQQIQIRELREQAEALLQKAKELEGTE